uniref:Secreted protein n=1 Tax=Arundo donax TaxID=35708 RepID=A0A0A9DC91_ARUDO
MSRQLLLLVQILVIPSDIFSTLSKLRHCRHRHPLASSMFVSCLCYPSENYRLIRSHVSLTEAKCELENSD